MQINKNNLALSFIVVLTCICFQLCFLENKAGASITVTNYNPADNATGVSVSGNLELTFSQSVTNYMMGKINIYKTSGATLVESFPIGSMEFGAPSPRVSGLGTATITIDPTADLEANTDYYVLIDVNTFYDGGSNYHAGITSNTTWNFSTSAGACYNPPSCIGPCFGVTDIQHLSPPDNAHFMQSYEGLAIVFGSNVTLGTGNLYIREYVGDATVSTIDVTSGVITGWGTNTLTINIPDNVLANNTHYYINFDIEGWSLPANKDNWDFWTKATPNTFSGSGL